jgi:hypothetical protein
VQPIAQALQRPELVLQSEQVQQPEQAPRKPVTVVLHRLAQRESAKVLQRHVPWGHFELRHQRLSEREALLVARLVNHLRSQSLNLRLDHACHDGYDDDGVCVLDRRCCRLQNRVGLLDRFADAVGRRFARY